MMKKQKIMLYRIIAAAIIYVPLFVLEHMGKLEFQSEIPAEVSADMQLLLLLS